MSSKAVGVGFPSLSVWSLRSALGEFASSNSSQGLLVTSLPWREVTGFPQSVAGGECYFLPISWESFFPPDTELSRTREQHCSAIKGKELVATACSSSRRNHASNESQAGTEARWEQKLSVILLGRKKTGNSFHSHRKCSLLFPKVVLECWQWFLLTVKF